jgi:ribonuclease-3
MSTPNRYPLPPLPHLDGDILLDVFTHSSLDYDAKPVNQDYGDNNRLAELGERVLSLAITQRLFYKKPLLTSLEIIEHREQYMSNESIEEWVTAYQLKKNLKFAPSALESVQTVEESKFLLYSYLGAVYHHHRGIIPIQNWIDRLVLPDPVAAAPAPPLPPSSPPRWQYAPQPPTSPQSPGAGMTALAQFNQIAQQHAYGVEWQAESSGPPHALRWTVKCIVNGVERGHGSGRSQKMAKEEAVIAAAGALGWSLQGV